MNEEPLISVVLPTYNVAQYLENIAALATRGFHYLMQLIGYYVVQYTADGGTVDDSINETLLQTCHRRKTDAIYPSIRVITNLKKMLCGASE